MEIPDFILYILYIIFYILVFSLIMSPIFLINHFYEKKFKKKCPHCQTVISKKATKCPHCQEFLKE